MIRYDVIVYEIATNKVTNILGSNLRRTGAFNSAESRHEMILSRINDKFNADIVPAGTYKVGDIRT